MAGDRDRSQHDAASLALRILSVIPARFDVLLPPDIDPRPKIFGIGFHKTGTTTLGRSLRQLGYRVQKGFSINTPGKRIRIPEPVTLEKVRDVAFRMVPYYGAFEDNPWPLLFKEADRAFPGSKFILTERDPENWARSAAKHFGSRMTPHLDLIHGRSGFRMTDHQDEAVARFLRHNEEVRTYFTGREDDLLIWDIETDPSWQPLCTFLGCKEPGRRLPHGKKSDYQDTEPE